MPSTPHVLAVALLVGHVAGCAPSQPGRVQGDRATVSSEDLRNPGESVESALQRKVPGLLVRRSADGSLALQIRGTSDYAGRASMPLYVLNGAPFQPGPEGALTGINPEDIQSVKVLRGAEAGIYGIEGANGVIVITTRKAAGPKR